MPAVAFPEPSARVTPRSTLAPVAEAGVPADTTSTPTTRESAGTTRNRTRRRLFEDIFPLPGRQLSLRADRAVPEQLPCCSEAMSTILRPRLCAAGSVGR